MASREYPVIELRRYEIKPGERERFGLYFESYLPEAFEQIGFVGLGQFHERKNENVFTWIRAFPSYDARPDMSTEFYRGPLWKELGTRFNDRILDIENVLLLRPLAAGRGLGVQPPVDVVTGGDEAAGIVVLQIFAVKPGSADAAAGLAEESFAAYRAAGAHEAGVLVTLDAPNNYPRLPVRADGPHLVWVGVVKDEVTLQTRLVPLAERAAGALGGQGLLRGAPELVLLDPTRRSRLRWRSEWSGSRRP